MDVSWEPVQQVLRKLRLWSLKALHFCSEIIMAKYFYDLKVFSIMNHLKELSYLTANYFRGFQDNSHIECKRISFY